MIIREMRASDAKSIRAIAKDAWRATYSSFIPEEIQNQVLEEAYSESEMTNRFQNFSNLVAEENGQILGYAFLTDKKSDKQLFLESLYIHPSFQGRGIGRRLLHKGISMFPKATAVSLTVYKGNPNLTFYEKEGFKVMNENRGDFFGHPVTFILMEKVIVTGRIH